MGRTQKYDKTTLQQWANALGLSDKGSSPQLYKRITNKFEKVSHDKTSTDATTKTAQKPAAKTAQKPAGKLKPAANTAQKQKTAANKTAANTPLKKAGKDAPKTMIPQAILKNGMACQPVLIDGVPQIRWVPFHVPNGTKQKKKDSSSTDTSKTAKGDKKKNNKGELASAISKDKKKKQKEENKAVALCAKQLYKYISDNAASYSESDSE